MRVKKSAGKKLVVNRETLRLVVGGQRDDGGGGTSWSGLGPQVSCDANASCRNTCQAAFSCLGTGEFCTVP